MFTSVAYKGDQAFTVWFLCKFILVIIYTGILWVKPKLANITGNALFIFFHRLAASGQTTRYGIFDAAASLSPFFGIDLLSLLIPG